MSDCWKKRGTACRRTGTSFVVSAPSGAGKTTLCRKLLEKKTGIKLSVSYTTRPPRKGEVNDVHYTFISERKFKGMIDRGEFAEWAVVHGNMYGTSIKRLKKLNKEGYDIILDIDIHGARQLKKNIEDAVYIFVLPPSMDVLEKRLSGRGTDSEEVMTERLKNAQDEMAACFEYDYIIINERLEKAYTDMESIINAAKLRTEKIDRKMVKSLLK